MPKTNHTGLNHKYVQINLYWSFWRMVGIQLIVLKTGKYQVFILSFIYISSLGNQRDEVKFLFMEVLQLLKKRLPFCNPK